MTARETSTLLRLCLPLIAAAAFSVAPLFADDDDAPDGAAGNSRSGGDVEFVMRRILGGDWSAAAARRRLDELLQRKIVSFARLYDLTDAQKQKLRLAGRGDIQRLFTEIEEVASEFRDAEGDRLNDLYNAVQPLRAKLNSGPFDKSSLLQKALSKTPTEEQLAAHEKRRLAVGKARVTLDNAAGLMKIGEIARDVYQLDWTPDGKSVGLLAFNNPLEIVDPTDYSPQRTIAEGRRLAGFNFSPDRRLVAICENSTKAAFIDLESGQETWIDTGNAQPAVRFSPDGKTLATGGYGKSAKLWSTATGELLHELNIDGHEGGLTPVFSPDGALVAIGNRNSTTCLFDVESGRLVRVLPKLMTQGLKFDPSGKILAVTYVDATLSLWDVATGRNLTTRKAPAEELYCVDWSSDGKMLVTSGVKTPVTLWDARDLSILNELDAPEWVISARFSPDGTKLFFSGGSRMPKERRVEIWGAP